MKLITLVKVNKYLKMATWWQQQEVLQLLLVTVKVLLASFLLVLLPLVLALATLSQVNDNDCCSINKNYCSIELYVPDTAGAPPGAPGAVPGQADT